MEKDFDYLYVDRSEESELDDGFDYDNEDGTVDTGVNGDPRFSYGAIDFEANLREYEENGRQVTYEYFDDGAIQDVEGLERQTLIYKKRLEYELKRDRESALQREKDQKEGLSKNNEKETAGPDGPGNGTEKQGEGTEGTGQTDKIQDKEKSPEDKEKPPVEDSTTDEVTNPVMTGEAERIKKETAAEKEQVSNYLDEKGTEKEGAGDKEAQGNETQAKGEGTEGTGKADEILGKDKPALGGRITDMTDPAMDGGVERMDQKTAAEKGQVSSYLNEQGAGAVKKAQQGITKLSNNEKKKESAGTKIGQSEKAVEIKPEEKQSEANTAQVKTVDKADTPKTDKAEARNTLDEKLQSSIPKDLEALDEFKDTGKGQEISKGVQDIVGGQAAGIKETYKKIEDSPDPEAPRPAEKLPDIEKAVGTPNLQLDTGLVPPTTKEQTDLTAFSEESDKLLDREGITEEQLGMVDSGDLFEAKQGREELKTDVADAPGKVAEEEKKEKGKLNKELASEEQQEKAKMRRDREKGLGEAQKDQQKTKTDFEKKREEVTAKINGIYEKANETVKKKLANLEKESMAAFDQAVKRATATFENNVKTRFDAYKEKRYGDWLGWARWTKDKLWGMDELPEVKKIFEEEKQRFVQSIDSAINRIMRESERVISECKEIISNAKEEIQEYVDGLGPGLKKVGETAQAGVEKKLEALDAKVNAAAEALKKKLDEKRAAAIEAIDKRIEEMKEEMSGALSKLGNLLLDAAFKFFKWVLEKAGLATDTLMGVLNKGKAVITSIVTKPVEFVGNLVASAKGGFQRFGDNIQKHLTGGLVGWLTGAVGGEVRVPETFDVKGVVGMAADVMGLSWNFLRGRLVKVVPEEMVSAAEKGFDVVQILVKEGPLGLWEYIKEEAESVKQAVVDGIKSWVITTVVKKAIIKVATMLNPAGAIVQAVIAIYDAIMFFVDNIQRIIDTVKSLFDSITKIASGQIGEAIAAVENTMARTVPIIISFLARFLGLGGIGKKIKQIIEKVRKPIVNAVDKGIKKISTRLRAWFSKSKGGRKKVSKKQIDKQVTKDEKEKDKKGFNIFAKLKAYSGAKIKGGHTLKSDISGELAIHSKIKKLNSFLRAKQEEVHSGKGTDPKHAEKQSAINEVKLEKKNFGKILAKYKGKQKKDYNASVKPDYELLKASMKKIAKNLGVLGINIDDTSLLPTKVQHTVSGGKAQRVWAEPLTKVPGNTRGSSPGSSVPKGWEKIDPTDRSKNWVRAHLVNHHLHGPGKEWNLFPAHKTVNSDMEAKIESVAKRQVHGKGNSTYYYDAKLTYGNGDFPTKLDVEFGTYDPESKTRKKIGDPYAKTLTQPSTTYTVNLNTDSATRLQEVAKANGVTGLSSFFNNLVKERKDNGVFDDTDDIQERVKGATNSHLEKLEDLIDKDLINI